MNNGQFSYLFYKFYTFLQYILIIKITSQYVLLLYWGFFDGQIYTWLLTTILLLINEGNPPTTLGSKRGRTIKVYKN